MCKYYWEMVNICGWKATESVRERENVVRRSSQITHNGGGGGDGYDDDDDDDSMRTMSMSESIDMRLQSPIAILSLHALTLPLHWSFSFTCWEFSWCFMRAHDANEESMRYASIDAITTTNKINWSLVCNKSHAIDHHLWPHRLCGHKLFMRNKFAIHDDTCKLWAFRNSPLALHSVSLLLMLVSIHVERRKKEKIKNGKWTRTFVMAALRPAWHEPCLWYPQNTENDKKK